MNIEAFLDIERRGPSQDGGRLQAKRRPTAMRIGLALSLVSCGFPRPADLGGLDAGIADGSTDGGGSDCHADDDCHDPTRSVCVFGQCVSPAAACQQAGNERIVFLSNRGGALEIWGAYANGGGPTRLASGIVADGNVAPSPDGALLAFVQQSSTNSNNSIVTVDAFGRNLHGIAGTFDQASYVEWSPDGTGLVVAGRSSEQTPVSTVYAVKRDGHEQQLMGFADSAALNSDPTWAPDSTRVAFVSKSPTQLLEIGIWIVNADGTHGTSTEEQSFLANSPNYLTPRWAPSGAAIAYLSTEKGNPDIVLKQLNGSAGHLLATPDNESDLAWSHDSSKIAFVRASGASRTIWVMNADGSAPTSLTAGEHPRWSPDDKSILFDTSRDGNREIYRMNSDGTNPVNLTNDPGDDSQAEWTACPN